MVASDLLDPRLPVVTVATRLARSISARVTVVHKVEPTGPAVSLELARGELIEGTLDSLVDALRPTPLRTVFVRDASPPAVVVGSLARQRHADLTVVGVRPGRGTTVTGLLAADLGGSILALPLPPLRGAA